MSSRSTSWCSCVAAYASCGVYYCCDKVTRQLHKLGDLPRRLQQARAHRVAAAPPAPHLWGWLQEVQPLVPHPCAPWNSTSLSWYRGNVTEPNHLTGGYSKTFFVKKTEKEQLLRLLLSQLPQKQTCKFQQHQFQAKLAVELANITPKEQKLPLLVSRLKLAFCLHNTLTLTLSVFKTRQRKMGRGKDLRTEMRTRQRYLGSCSNSEGWFTTGRAVMRGLRVLTASALTGESCAAVDRQWRRMHGLKARAGTAEPQENGLWSQAGCNCPLLDTGEL